MTLCATPLRCVIKTRVRVTPITALAQTRAQAMNGGMTDANIAAANAANAAMMGDVVDGVINGKNGANQISMGGMMGASMMSSTAGSSGLLTALTNFTGSAANASGLTLTEMTAFMQKLVNFNGQI